jgi:HK97 gp10 family phage protein
MADGVTVKIAGLEQLSQRMQDFPDKLVRKGVKDALRAGGEVLREAISAGAPRSMDETHGHEPGFLADHIAMNVSTSVKNDRGSVKVGPVKKAFYAMFAEFGTRHQPALPFIRPAFEGNGQNALDAFVNKLREAFKDALQ